MIRFCDMEFDSAEYASLTRRELLNYFCLITKIIYFLYTKILI